MVSEDWEGSSVLPKLVDPLENLEALGTTIHQITDEPELKALGETGFSSVYKLPQLIRATLHVSDKYPLHDGILAGNVGHQEAVG